MVSPCFGDLLRPFDIVSGQMLLKVFLIIHRQSQSFRSLLLYRLLSLLILRLWSCWSPSRSNLVDPLCFSVPGLWSPLSLFPGLSFPHQDWAAAISSNYGLCPCPVGPSLPPCSLLVVRSGGNFRRVVSGGGLPYLHCQWAFGGRSRSPPLSFFTVHFHILSVRCCGFSTDLAGPRFTHPALRWPRISPVDSVPPPLPSPTFCGWEQWSWWPGFPRVWQSRFPSSSFHLVNPFVPGGTLGLVFLFILLYIIL